MVDLYYSDILLLAFLFIVTTLYIITLKSKNKRIKKLEGAKTKEIKNIFKERWEKEEQSFQLKQSELSIKEKEIESKIVLLETQLKGKEEHYNEINQDLSVYKKKRIEDIDNELSARQAHKLEMLQRDTENAKKVYTEQITKVINEKETELEAIKEELEEIRSRREAVNQEILRQRKLNDDKDFYCIQLDPALTSDISLLRSIAPRLINPTAVNKLIWTAYYQKPLAELRKRLLPDGDYSGIYKITRNKTGEIYIGQTTSIDKRFQDHVKSALGVGTLATSTLHRLMEKDGPENFSFEIIEKVEKDKLKEKEAFYIDFYDSKNYGMNSISGVKK